MEFALHNQADAESRVVVTGMGILTALGETLDQYCAALQAGRSGITRWKRMDPRIYSKVGGDMSDFDLAQHLARVGRDYPEAFVRRANKLLRATPLSGRMTAAAALQAFLDAGLPAPQIPLEEFAHVIAGTNLNMPYIYENAITLHDDPEFIDPLYGLYHLDTDVLSVTSELLGIKGPSFTMGGACGSGNLAVAAGLDLIRAGRARTVLVSGAALPADAVVLQGWALIDAIAFRSFNDEPARASRPFDRRREGFVPSEGAGAIVLESLASARARHAQIYAEIRGGASTSDASRLTRPSLDGQVRAIRATLKDAQLDASDIDYVNAHATSTPLGDAVEVMAIKTALGPRAHEIPVNSTKSMVGHCVMSAAVVELIATILQINHGFVHPTINQEECDPELDLDFVPNHARDYTINYALSNSFGFGGINSCVAVARYS